MLMSLPDLPAWRAPAVTSPEFSFHSRRFRSFVVVLAMLSAFAWGATGIADPMDDVKAATRVKDYERAASLLTALAEAGDAEAQYQLAALYRAGQGVTKDHEAAVRWLRLAAEQNHPKAQYHLGVMFERGWGVPIDQEQANHWFRLAAAQGHVMAQARLGGDDPRSRPEKSAASSEAGPPKGAGPDALRHWVRKGRKDKVQDILRQGADVNSLDRYGRTVLMDAVTGRYRTVAKMLLDQGAEPNIKDRYGDSALHIAARQDDAGMTEVLIGGGADINARDGNGSTPLIVAATRLPKAS